MVTNDLLLNELRKLIPELPEHIKYLKIEMRCDQAPSIEFVFYPDKLVPIETYKIFKLEEQ